MLAELLIFFQRTLSKQLSTTNATAERLWKLVRKAVICRTILGEDNVRVVAISSYFKTNYKGGGDA